MLRLVIVSNRVPIPDRTGKQVAGGLAIALREGFKGHQGLWFGWSGKVAAQPTPRRRPRRRGAVLCQDERCGRETPRAAATALTGRPPATRSRARAAFWGRSRAPPPRAGSRSRASSCPAGAAAHGSADGPHAARRPEPPLRRRQPPSARLAPLVDAR